MVITLSFLLHTFYPDKQSKKLYVTMPAPMPQAQVNKVKGLRHKAAGFFSRFAPSE
jgi:hypothetical protein